MAEMIESEPVTIMQESSESSWKKYLINYNHFVIKNPLIASEMESCLKWFSYLTAGRFRYSHVVSELLFSASSLLTLVNDAILRKAVKMYSDVDPKIRKLKFGLAFIEYIEVFVEVASMNVGGNALRWIIVFIIQLVKSAMKMILLLYYKRGITNTPPLPPFNRRQAAFHLQNPTLSLETSNPKGAFVLHRSKRVMRTLEASPPLSLRDWKPPMISEMSMTSTIQPIPTDLTRNQTIGEILHILRPLAHLVATATFGQKSWVPWGTAFGMDITSLKMLGNTKEMNFRERAEITRRTLTLLLYILRSPAYEKFSQKRIHIVLSLFRDIPVMGMIVRPLLQYLPEWQKIYFYLWNH